MYRPRPAMMTKTVARGKSCIYMILCLYPLRCRGQCHKYLYQRSTLFCISVSLKEQQGFCQRQLALRRVSAHRKIVGTRHPVHKYKQLVFSTVYKFTVDVCYTNYTTFGVLRCLHGLRRSCFSSIVSTCSLPLCQCVGIQCLDGIVFD